MVAGGEGLIRQASCRAQRHYDAATVRERLTSHPWIAPLKPTAQRAVQTAAPMRFFAREAAQRGGVAIYGLRHAPQVKVAVRHHTPDIDVFDEILCRRIYDVPESVARAVAALGRPPRVLDLGANVGVFAAWAAARWPGAEITCVEPDPANADVLRATAAANGDAWRLVEAAAGTAAGELRFLSHRFAVSRALLPGEEDPNVITVPVVDALELARDHDVVKLDIEGGEWAILGDPRLAAHPPVAITLEYHAELCPVGDTHGHAAALLKAAGYRVLRVPLAEGAPEPNGGLWAWRPSTFRS
jgi:FkbM family methyltransferase